MKYLLQFLSDITGSPEQARLLFSILIGLASMMFVLALMLVGAGAYSPLRRRLRALGAASRPDKGAAPGIMSRFAGPLSPYLVPREGRELSQTRARLIQAGFHAEEALPVYYAVKTVLGLLFAGGVLVGTMFLPGRSTMFVMSATLGAGLFGMMVPNVFLSHRVERRQRALMNAFPDALDLLVCCAEAGLGLNAALQRVANELAVSYPELAAELAIVNAQVRAGVDRVAALKNLAERTGLADIRGLVSVIAQSMRFGTSIADTLRVYSEEYRDKRMQAAEEAAAKIGTKLIFPLVLCMFPSFFVVMVGPAVIGIVRVLEANPIVK